MLGKSGTGRWTISEGNPLVRSERLGSGGRTGLIRSTNGPFVFLCHACGQEHRFYDCMHSCCEDGGICVICYHDALKTPDKLGEILRMLSDCCQSPEAYETYVDIAKCILWNRDNGESLYRFREYSGCPCRIFEELWRRTADNELSDLIREQRASQKTTLKCGSEIVEFGKSDLSAVPDQLSQHIGVLDQGELPTAPVVIHLVGFAGAGKSIFAQRIAYQIFVETAKIKPELCRGYNIDPKVIDASIDYADPLLSNVGNRAYFTFTKITDDTNGIIGKSINEEEAVTSFHGRNENASSLRYHQMKFKNFNLKPRVEIETSNVLVRKEHVHHNVLAYSRRYDFVILCGRHTNLFTDHELRMIPKAKVPSFYQTCIDMTSHGLQQHIDSMTDTKITRKSAFVKDVVQTLIKNEAFAKDNMRYREEAVSSLKKALTH